ncbi:MAG: ABC transporter ATP-binding protein [Planktomarina sp.]|uniref:ABC transporter ATP-binding protein n=1 Tax=Planktomarina sp. TaxID=2024851 RepID=UPI002891E95F|nr:ABC transporter ATP-binding protein [Planktomarina sp.]MDT2031332.1 ABC transporter ATP-binding protein [Planktomarina sp.]MDT2070917.1 ABC transporter ATP-binding protein [Planktomarina sp.]
MIKQQAHTIFEPWLNPTEKPIIQFKNVTKRFGDYTAIENLSLDIYPKEFFALLGPSGCGKTTLMRLLAGFEAPSEGKIILDNIDIVNVPPNMREVNMMFQSYALFPHLNVYDNIAFGLRRSAMNKADIPDRVDEMLRLTQLVPLAKRKPHQISGGQRQRVALARSLAKAPKLLLLDEPLGALDKKLRHETQFELMNIQEKTGTTFVIVTHDQEEAMTVASRVAVMDEGKIVQVATPDRIYETPNTIYVADFIGDVNFIKGKAQILEDNRILVNWAEGQQPIIGTSEDRIDNGADITFAIRPEKIAISFERPLDIANVIKGKILDIAYLGNISTYHLELPTGQNFKAQATNTRRIERRTYTWNDEVWLSWTDTAGVILSE